MIVAFGKSTAPLANRVAEPDAAMHFNLGACYRKAKGVPQD